MKTIVAAFVFALITADAMAQPVKIRLFTAPDDGGFVTSESKARQFILDKVTEKISKEGRVKKVMVLADDALVTVEILAVETSGTGTSKTQTSALGAALKQPSLTDTIQIRETKVRAILRFRELEKELVSVHRTGELGDDQILFKELLLAFVKDNAAKLR